MKDRWEKLEKAIAVSADLPEAEREAWLGNFCSDDISLRREIESLLRGQNESSTFLESAGPRYAAHLLLDDDHRHAGKQFGKYTIVRELGRGGMGTVYLAKRADGEFTQDVALKIVRQTLLDDELERRFKRERQILAD